MSDVPVPGNDDSKPHLIRRVLLPLIVISVMVLAALIGGNEKHDPVVLGRLHLDFAIFGGALIAIALSNRMRWEPRDIALSGLGLVLAHHLYRGTDLVGHLTEDHYHELRTLGNVAGLLLGFAVMARTFEQSKLSDWLPQVLPDDWKGGAVLLIIVALGSVFLDNIAAAMIGGVIAKEVFKHRLTVGYLAAIVAASNAGGAPSVVGDTTTTMIWIAGVSPLRVLPAAIGSLTAVLIIAYFAAKQQDAHQRIERDPIMGVRWQDIRWKYNIVVLWALMGCIAANFLLDFPALGVWTGLAVGSFLLKKGELPWHAARHMVRETVFILSLVAMAGLMPVNELPTASWRTAFGLGGVSSVFDNIPLTALAIKQNGYDWALLSFAVGFGGSMTWFGSTAGVALCGEFPQAKNLFAWLRQGWFVIVGYAAGFGVMLVLWGWNPSPIRHVPETEAVASPASTAEIASQP